MDTVYERMNLAQVLDDLQIRFIINIPEEELSSIERICFQIEQAHWYYEDFVREQNPALPSYSLKSFCAMFFRHCPLLDSWAHDHEKAFNNFMQYKVRVPVCGAIILNQTMDKVLLVRGFKSSASWMFPRGKININEAEQDCAVREIQEEVGIDISPYIKSKDFIEIIVKEQKIKLYIVCGISDSMKFETKTRKEIGAIEWFKLTDVPGWNHGKSETATPIKKAKFFLVTVFMGRLRKWIGLWKKQKKSKKQSANGINFYSGYKSETESDVNESGVPDSDHDLSVGLVHPQVAPQINQFAPALVQIEEKPLQTNPLIDILTNGPILPVTKPKIKEPSPPTYHPDLLLKEEEERTPKRTKTEREKPAKISVAKSRRKSKEASVKTILKREKGNPLLDFVFDIEKIMRAYESAAIQ